MITSGKFKKILSAFLVAAFIAAPLADFFATGVYAAEVVKGASVTFNSSLAGDRASAVISSVTTADNYAVIGAHEGRKCVITQWQRDVNYYNIDAAIIPILVDDSFISENDRNIAVKVTYFDHGWDVFRVYYYTATGERNSVTVTKYGTNTWKTATVLLKNPSFSGKGPHNCDLWITPYETDIGEITEYISKIEIINLDKTYTDPYVMSKTDILHITEACALNSMNVLENFTYDGVKYGLDKPVTLGDTVKFVINLIYGGTGELKYSTCSNPDVPHELKPYIGLALKKGIIRPNSDGTVGVYDFMTMRRMLDIFILAVQNKGYYYIGDTTMTRAKDLGLIINVFDDHDYGMSGVRVYNVVPGLMTKEINNVNRFAYMDDLAGVGYNAMGLTVYGHENPIMAELYERNIFTRDELVSSGCGELLLDFYRQTEFTLVEESYVDQRTGVTVNIVGLPGLLTSTGYSHSQGLTSDGKIMILCAGLDSSTNYGHIVAYNRETKKTTVLNPDFKESYNYGFMLCSNTNDVIYTCGRELFCYNLTTGVNRLVATQTNDTDVWCCVPSVTADGELVALFGTDYKNRKPMNIDTVNIHTGEITKTLTGDDTRQLTTDSDRWEIDYINHVNINPVYKNLYYYIRHNKAKDGVTTDAPKEVWTYNSETGEHKLISRSHLNENGAPDELMAHWVWSGDGERNYFIKYYASDYITSLPGQGIVYVTKDGNSNASVEGVVNGDYPYNHMAVTPDDKWFVADNSTQWGGESYVGKVVLVDGTTGVSRLLADDVIVWNNHPGHTHPLISDDGSTVYYTMADSNLRLVGAYIDLTTLPQLKAEDYITASVELGEKPVEKGIAKYDEFSDREGYSPLITKTSTAGGKSCLEIPKGHYNPFDVYPQYIGVADNVVTVQIEYYDNGTEPIVFEYNSNHLDWNYDKRDNAVYKFNRTGKNRWLTHTFTLSDVSFRNAQAGVGDFKISAESSNTSVYIKSIKACKGTSIN